MEMKYIYNISYCSIILRSNNNEEKSVIVIFHPTKRKDLKKGLIDRVNRVVRSSYLVT